MYQTFGKYLLELQAMHIINATTAKMIQIQLARYKNIPNKSSIEKAPMTPDMEYIADTLSCREYILEQVKNLRTKDLKFAAENIIQAQIIEQEGDMFQIHKKQNYTAPPEIRDIAIQKLQEACKI